MQRRTVQHRPDLVVHRCKDLDHLHVQCEYRHGAHGHGDIRRRNGAGQRARHPPHTCAPSSTMDITTQRTIKHHTCMRNPPEGPSTPTTGPPWERPATHHIHAIQHTSNATRPPLSCTRSEGCALKGKQPPTGTGHRPTHTTHNMATCSGASHLGQSIARQYGSHEAPRGKALCPKS